MIEKILKEINRLKKELKGYSASEALDYIESYINIISREPASEDLEEEIERWIKEKHFIFTEIDEIIETARHFTEWQRKKDQETIELAEDHAMLAGMEKMREEMMKNAVDAWVNTYESPDGCYYVEFVIDEPPANYRGKKNAKIIIVKEE